MASILPVTKTKPMIIRLAVSSGDCSVDKQNASTVKNADTKPVQVVSIQNPSSEPRANLDPVFPCVPSIHELKSECRAGVSIAAELTQGGMCGSKSQIIPVENVLEVNNTQSLEKSKKVQYGQKRGSQCLNLDLDSMVESNSNKNSCKKRTLFQNSESILKVYASSSEEQNKREYDNRNLVSVKPCIVIQSSSKLSNDGGDDTLPPHQTTTTLKSNIESVHKQNKIFKDPSNKYKLIQPVELSKKLVVYPKKSLRSLSSSHISKSSIKKNKVENVIDSPSKCETVQQIELSNREKMVSLLQSLGEHSSKSPKLLKENYNFISQSSNLFSTVGFEFKQCGSSTATTNECLKEQKESLENVSSSLSNECDLLQRVEVAKNVPRVDSQQLLAISTPPTFLKENKHIDPPPDMHTLNLLFDERFEVLSELDNVKASGSKEKIESMKEKTSILNLNDSLKTCKLMQSLELSKKNICLDIKPTSMPILNTSIIERKSVPKVNINFLKGSAFKSNLESLKKTKHIEKLPTSKTCDSVPSVELSMKKMNSDHEQASVPIVYSSSKEKKSPLKLNFESLKASAFKANLESLKKSKCIGNLHDSSKTCLESSKASTFKANLESLKKSQLVGNLDDSSKTYNLMQPLEFCIKEVGLDLKQSLASVFHMSTKEERNEICLDHDQSIVSAFDSFSEKEKKQIRLDHAESIVPVFSASTEEEQNPKEQSFTTQSSSLISKVCSNFELDEVKDISALKLNIKTNEDVYNSMKVSQSKDAIELNKIEEHIDSEHYLEIPTQESKVKNVVKVTNTCKSVEKVELSPKKKRLYKKTGPKKTDDQSEKCPWIQHPELSKKELEVDYEQPSVMQPSFYFLKTLKEKHKANVPSFVMSTSTLIPDDTGLVKENVPMCVNKKRAYNYQMEEPDYSKASKSVLHTELSKKEMVDLRHSPKPSKKKDKPERNVIYPSKKCHSLQKVESSKKKLDMGSDPTIPVSPKENLNVNQLVSSSKALKIKRETDNPEKKKHRNYRRRSSSSNSTKDELDSLGSSKIIPSNFKLPNLSFDDELDIVDDVGDLEMSELEKIRESLKKQLFQDTDEYSEMDGFKCTEEDNKKVNVEDVLFQNVQLEIQSSEKVDVSRPDLNQVSCPIAVNVLQMDTKSPKKKHAIVKSSEKCQQIDPEKQIDIDLFKTDNIFEVSSSKKDIYQNLDDDPKVSTPSYIDKASCEEQQSISDPVTNKPPLFMQSSNLLFNDGLDNRHGGGGNDSTKLEMDKEPLRKKLKLSSDDCDDLNIEDCDKTQEESFLEDKLLILSEDSTSIQAVDSQNDEENEEMEFDILDEFESDGNDPDEEDDDDDESYISTDEIDAMLDEGLYQDKSKTNKKITCKNKEFEHEEKEKIILKVRGRNHFDVLPEGWIEVTHNSGMPIYLHKISRVCSVSKPYFLGPGSTRKHEIPVSAIPCLHYLKELEKERAQMESKENQEDNNNDDHLPNNINRVSELASEVMNMNGTAEKVINSTNINGNSVCNGIVPSAKLESVKDNKESGSLDFAAVREYCKKRFEFQTITVKRFKTWAGRRKHQKQIRVTQRPFLPDSTKLITCPLYSSSDKATGSGGNSTKKEFIMNPSGKSPVCILHEYIQHTLRVQPKYLFKELESASTPYGAVVIIDGIEYGCGFGSSKKLAKSDAARSALEILIPRMKLYGSEEGREVQDVEFFDEVRVEDPRVCDLSVKAGQPYPYQILLECLKRNYGMGDTEVEFSTKNLKHQKNEFFMKVGKHSASVVCKNKRDGKHRASQAILQKLHPHIHSWGSLLRMYGKGSCKTLKEKKEEEQQITELQSKACANKPNMSILFKLKDEMMKYREKLKSNRPIGKLIPEQMEFFSTSSSNLKNVEL